MKKHMEIAISQLGKEESPCGSNWGEPVQSYLASVGITFPAAWCMAFVYWCLKQAGATEQATIPRTGGVLRMYNESKAYRVMVPQAGDIFIMDYGKGLGHTGFIERVSDDGETLYTIEGNTNDEGSREGYEVCRRTRKRGQCKGFLRFV